MNDLTIKDKNCNISIDKLGQDNEVCLSVYDTHGNNGYACFVNKEHAERIIAHLQAVFCLDNSSEDVKKLELAERTLIKIREGNGSNRQIINSYFMFKELKNKGES